MCGPSSQEQGLEANLSEFSNILQTNYSTLFKDQQQVLQSLNGSLSPIVSAGPSQQGMSPQQLAAEQTQAINTAGAASTAAQQYARTAGAGEGSGGGSGLTSGVQQQIAGAIASQQAGNEAARLNQIQDLNYNLGRENYWHAVQGEGGVASAYNPNAAMSGVTAANQGAFGEAKDINEQQNAEMQDIAGFATAAAGSAGTIAKAFMA